MSSYLSKNENGEYVKEIESMEVCKWKINEICVNDKSDYLADYPSPFCKCESKEDCEYFEKEEENAKKMLRDMGKEEKNANRK